MSPQFLPLDGIEFTDPQAVAVRSLDGLPLGFPGITRGHDADHQGPPLSRVDGALTVCLWLGAYSLGSGAPE